MRQEVTVIVMIDVQAAIDARTLDGNIYLFDNLRTQGSENEGTGDLISAANGAYWYNHTLDEDVVFNWLPYGIGALPPTLSPVLQQSEASTGDIKKFNELTTKLKETEDGKESLEDLRTKRHDIAQRIGATGKVKDALGQIHDTGIKVMNVKGETVKPAKRATSELSHLTPQISNITGEAVDKGVIFPAQYGTPISVKDGWYWCATVDANKTGVYAYTMHITLYKLSYVEEVPTWDPIFMTYDSHIKVTSVPKNNAFTNGPMGYLQIM